MPDDPTVHAVILAGGKGTRFWPRSRARRPKQILPIVSERTMLAETLDRIAPLVPTERVWVVTAGEQAAEIRAALPQIAAERILVEPIGRNTAAAIGLAAHAVAAADPRATMIVLPADHHVGAPQRFRDVLARAVGVAAAGDVLVTIGIRPTAAETGYGYIEQGEAIGDGVFRVARFTEKPDRARAERFLARGGYLWNSGMFVWRVDAIRAALAAHLPATERALGEIAATLDAGEAAARLYAALEDHSIDRGVLEKASNVAVIPGDFGWDDIGSWSALERLWPTDDRGNAVRGRVVVLDGRGNLVAADQRLVALVGVEELIVVETDDAVLVCRRDRAQDVKSLIEELRRRGWTEFL